ncbi:hypothetical protein MNBD_GAMMA12-3961, partial [hydrothermal vent metagenome]
MKLLLKNICLLQSPRVTRHVSDKVNPISSSNEPDYRHGLLQFVEEGCALAKFKHPNIIRVIQHFEENGTAYLVMEYENGVDLKQYLLHRPFPDEAILLNILLKLLDGIAKIHEENYIHRDIKPSNIYIRENGEPVLLDFGSAREALNRSRANFTRIVSDGYAPIEQYAQDMPLSPATDFYALGATLYFMVTGSALSAAQDRLTKLQFSETDLVKSAITIGNKKYSLSLLSTIDWMVTLHPEGRPQTVTDILKRLNNKPNARNPSTPQSLFATSQANFDTQTRPETSTESEQLLLSQAPTIAAFSSTATTRKLGTQRNYKLVTIVLTIMLALMSFILWQSDNKSPQAPTSSNTTQFTHSEIKLENKLYKQELKNCTRRNYQCKVNCKRLKIPVGGISLCYNACFQKNKSCRNLLKKTYQVRYKDTPQIYRRITNVSSFRPGELDREFDSVPDPHYKISNNLCHDVRKSCSLKCNDTIKTKGTAPLCYYHCGNNWFRCQKKVLNQHSWRKKEL